MTSTHSGQVAHGGTMDAEGNTLNPAGADEKTWGSFAIFNIWANDVQSLFGYSLVASLFISFGVGGWTAFAALITAGLFVMWMVNLSGAPGEKYGIPYPVLARASLGTQGAKLPAILRAIVAVFWYGVQVYFASTAVALLIYSVTGASGGTEYLGLTAVGWISFLIVWFFHIVIFWRGMNWVETFLNIAGPFVYLVMIGLVIVLWQRSDGQLLEATATIFANPEGTFWTEAKGFVAIVGTMVAYFAAVMINFSDFSRYAKDKPTMVRGNLLGLPFNMILFSALALLTTGGAAALVIVSGPVVEELGFEHSSNALGANNRVNATVGRFAQMMRYFCGKGGGVLDSHGTIGHPGRISFCIAEHPKTEWGPFHTQYGFPADASVVSVMST